MKLETLQGIRANAAAILVTLDKMIADLTPAQVIDGRTTYPLIVQGIAETCTQHAIDRFRERTGSKQPNEKIIRRFQSMLSSADEMVLKERFRVIEAMAHPIEAKYYREAGLIFVVEKLSLVTVHEGTADRWVRRSL